MRPDFIRGHGPGGWLVRTCHDPDTRRGDVITVERSDGTRAVVQLMSTRDLGYSWVYRTIGQLVGDGRGRFVIQTKAV